jgi:hypothetical protein
MEPDEVELLEAVAAALTRGQFEFTEEELSAAYQQVHAAKVGGIAASLVETGEVDLALVDGELQYVGQSGPATPPSED